MSGVNNWPGRRCTWEFFWDLKLARERLAGDLSLSTRSYFEQKAKILEGKLERSIKLRGWGEVPQGVYRSPRHRNELPTWEDSC